MQQCLTEELASKARCSHSFCFALCTNLSRRPRKGVLGSKSAVTCMQAYEEHVQELERLRWILETSHVQHVTTLAWQAKQAAMLDSMQVSINRAANANVQVISLLHVQSCHTIYCLNPCVSHSLCAVLALSPFLCQGAWLRWDCSCQALTPDCVPDRD